MAVRGATALGGGWFFELYNLYSNISYSILHLMLKLKKIVIEIHFILMDY